MSRPRFYCSPAAFDQFEADVNARWRFICEDAPQPNVLIPLKDEPIEAWPVLIRDESIEV